MATQNEVALWDLTTRQAIEGLPIGATLRLAFSPTDKLLAVGTWNAKGRAGG